MSTQRQGHLAALIGEWSGDDDAEANVIAPVVWWKMATAIRGSCMGGGGVERRSAQNVVPSLFRSRCAGWIAVESF